MKTKYRTLLLFTICISICCTHLSAQKTNRLPTLDEQRLLQTWPAFTEVSAAAVKAFGLEHCFVAEKIDSNICRRIRNRSFKPSCSTSLEELRYLKVLHYTREGKIRLGELICHQAISNDLLQIFRQLYEARYPIERMVLVDDYDADDLKSMEANNTSCFNYRPISGGKQLSKHSTGRAIDINPRYNPYVKTRNGRTTVSPQSAAPYTNRAKSFPYKIDRNDLCYRLFKAHGFTWGGDWCTLKDYQHFEK